MRAICAEAGLRAEAQAAGAERSRPVVLYGSLERQNSQD